MEKIWFREDVLEKLAKVDTVVLDIDGVIVAVEESFRQAICQGVQIYLTEIMGWSGKVKAIQPRETEFFKQAGGFNNDWDLALAVVMLYLKKNSQSNIKDIEGLRESPWSIEEYTDLLAKANGGLSSVEKVLGMEISPKVREEVADICKEVYAGEEFHQELYGGKVKYLPGQVSLIHQEKVLLDTSKLLTLKKKIAILTGRNWKEAQLVLNRIGLRLDREHILTDDDGLRKPDPKTLDCLAGRLGTRLGIFVGDTLDDIRTVRGTNSPWLAAGVLSGGGGLKNEPLFREEGASLIAGEINSLLDFLKEGGK